MKTKGRIIDKGGKKENPGLDEKTRVGVPTPVLMIAQGVLFGKQEYLPHSVSLEVDPQQSRLEFVYEDGEGLLVVCHRTSTSSGRCRPSPLHR